MNKIKIGIGVTTTKYRPKIYSLFAKNLLKYTTPAPEGFEFVKHVEVFYENKHKSIAEVKNNCLRELILQGCDYIYLFDDDCFPIHEDWWKPFLEAHLNSGNHHFCWLKDDSEHYNGEGRKLIETLENGITIFQNRQGCCLFFTRVCILATGAFNENFKPWGYEHDEYTFRAFCLGMNPSGLDLSVKDIENYIWSLDVQGAVKYRNLLGKEFDPQTGGIKSSRSMGMIKRSMDGNREYWVQRVNEMNEGKGLFIPLF